MTLEQYYDEIIKTDSADWNYNDDEGLLVCKNNILISIKKILPDNTEITEYNFTNSFSKTGGYRQVFYLNYCNSFVDAFYTVLADCYRVWLPFPNSKNEITERQYKICKLINSIIKNTNYDRYYDEYINSAKFIIK